MRLVTSRRVSQVFFVLLFVAFSKLASFGEGTFESRGWAINLFLWLDPLIALVTTLATGALYAGLAWAVLTVVVTAFLGRVFCGWVCPFGALHQAIGWLGRRRRPAPEQAASNQPSELRRLKVALLVAVVGAAALGAVHVDWLDPIVILTRALDLVLMDPPDGRPWAMFSTPRVTAMGWLIASLALAALLANLWVPRFYCRFLCPTGALLGWLGRWAPWRIGLQADRCTACGACERHCEGACSPSGRILTAECVLCWNCVDACPHGAVGFRSSPSAAGEVPSTSLSRRALAASMATGFVAAPLLRLDDHLHAGRSPGLVRPPGALPEEAFLERCISCDRCMRACYTNVLQPAGLDHGLEALWTPVLDMRVGSSACQPACVACGHTCPTGAIRPLSFEEKMGLGAFAEAGPIRIGLASVDRNLCLPWAFERPCDVCYEACPVAPKAIELRDVCEPIPGGPWTLRHVDGGRLTLIEGTFPAGKLGAHDYVARLLADEESLAGSTLASGAPARLVASAADVLEVAAPPEWLAALRPGGRVDVCIRLKRPVVEPDRCTGCGLCEHACPVRGQRAIRVSAEHETRSGERLTRPRENG